MLFSENKKGQSTLLQKLDGIDDDLKFTRQAKSSPHKKQMLIPIGQQEVSVNDSNVEATPAQVQKTVKGTC